MATNKYLLLCVLGLFTINLNGQVSGTVFQDLPFNGSALNSYGVKDANEVGVSGVTVTVYPGGASTTTASDGTYGPIGGAGDVRIEFSGWSGSLKESPDGDSGNSSVQFATTGDVVNFGLHKPSDFVQVNPYISTSVYFEGAFNGANSSERAHVKIPLSATGHHFSGTSPNASYLGVTNANYNNIGTTYGSAWQKSSKKLYLGAFQKRYSGYGPNGPDAIYQVDPNTNTVTGVIELDMLTGTSNSAGMDPHDFATMVSGDIIDLGVGNASYSKVTKMGFGDIDISENDSTLFAVNLLDKKIYVIDVSDGVAANASLLQTWTVPDPCTNTRPFALAIKDNKIFIGLTCEDGTASSVYSSDIDINASSLTFNLELSIDLTYSRENIIGGSTSAQNKWHAWSNDPSTITYGLSGTSEIWYPQPILSDIEFDATGMIIGFRDRFGDQTGTGLPFTNSSGLTWGTSGGDIIRACGTVGAFSLESGSIGGGACDGVTGLNNSGVNGIEFYAWDVWGLNAPSSLNPNTNGFHHETTQGGLVQVPGDDDVITTDMDPNSDYSGGVLKLRNDGVREGGGNANFYTLFETGDFSGFTGSPNANTFGKANGLGDLELLADPAPIEIGNLVWDDANSNGIQDAGEVGISGVVVELQDAGGTQITTATTDANGNYIFSNDPNGTSTASHIYNVALAANTAYKLVVPTTNAGDNLTTANSGEGSNSDINDSDANTSTGVADVLASDITSIGVNNHSFDFGFSNAPPPCEFLIATTQLSTCVNGTFDANLTLDWSNGPTTGGFEYSVDGGAFQPLARTNFSANATAEPVVIPNLPCEVTKLIEMRFATASTCYAQMMFVFPPADPSGYAYCIESGEIITGGSISVTPPVGGMVNIIEDGSTGHYQWLAVGSPVVSGLYQMTYTPAVGYTNTGTAGVWPGDTDDILDPTLGSEDNTANADPLVLGALANGAGTHLVDFTSSSNPFFMDFMLDLGDPLIDLNNIPLSGCAVCNIVVDSAVPTACDPSTNKYDLSVTVSYSTGPGGNITISTDNGQSESFMSTGTSPETFTLTDILSDGITGIDVTAVFDGDAACTDTSVDAYDAPTSCCPGPYEICPGESYTLTAQAGLSTYQWWEDNGSGTYVMIPGETNMTYTATSIGTYKWTGTDGTGCPAESCCPVTFIEGTNCCVLDLPIVTVECNNNGTPGDTMDDTFTYMITVTGMATTTYAITGSDTQTGLAYGIANGPYGPFNIASGNLILTITDEGDATCQQTPILVNAPLPCSTCPPPVCLPVMITVN